MKSATRRELLWHAAFLAVLAAWILAWRAAPFAGWDILFYVLLLAFLIVSYGFWHNLVQINLVLRAVRPAPEEEEIEIGQFSLEKNPGKANPLWKDLGASFLGVGFLAGIFYCLHLLRSDRDWFLSHVGGPLAAVILAATIADMRVKRRWRRRGRKVPDEA